MACISNVMVRPCIFSASRIHLFHRQAQAALSTLQQSRPSFLCSSMVAARPLSVGGGDWTKRARARTTMSPVGVGFGGRNQFSVGASDVNDAGSIDSPLMQSMEKKIKEHLNAESVVVKDAYGDGRHVRKLELKLNQCFGQRNQVEQCNFWGVNMVTSMLDRCCYSIKKAHLFLMNKKEAHLSLLDIYYPSYIER